MLTVLSDNARKIVVEGRATIFTLLFLEDGKHLLSGGEDGMIRQWSIEDGKEVREPIEGSERVRALALSGDRKWIISGEFKLASVWNRTTWQKVLAVHEHTLEVETVDISPDSTKFATGARDKRAFIWDISTGRRLAGPLEHDDSVVTVKFSPDGEHIVTAAWECETLRIYNMHTGQLMRTVPVKAVGINTIAWTSDSQRIFASSENNINHIYVDTGSIISQWTVPGDTNNAWGSLAVPTNGRFIAAFVGSSLSFLEPSTGERFGPIFDHPDQRLRSVVLSIDNSHVATSGENGIITLRALNGIIPVPYLVQRPRNANPVAQRLQIEAFEALRGVLRTLEARFGAFFEMFDLCPTEPNPNHR